MLKLDAIGAALGSLWLLHRLGLWTGLAHRVVYGRKLGRRARFGRGACVVGRQVKIGKDVVIGGGTSIAAEFIEIADGVQIGSGVKIRCRRLVLRAGARIDSGTTVYGMTTPNSALVLGERAWIFPDCYINVDESVQVGDRSAIGGQSLVFTHSSYLPVTAGYPVKFAPVILGKEVWAPWRVFILPGTTVGDGAVLGALSLVGGTVPPRSLAVGVPAKVVKDEQSLIRRYSPQELVALGERILLGVLDNIAGGFKPVQLFFPRKLIVSMRSSTEWVLDDGSDSLSIVWLPDGRPSGNARAQPRTLYVSIGCSEPPLEGANWIDLSTLRAIFPTGQTRLAREFIESFSSQGIRFGWREMTDRPEG